MYKGIGNVFWRGVELYREARMDRASIDQYGKGCPDDWIERKLYTRWATMGPTILLFVMFAPVSYTHLLAIATQFAGIDQGFDVERLAGARDARVFEQADHEGLQCLCARGFTDRLLALPPGEREQAEQGQADHQGQRDRPAMAAQELARAITEAWCAREDRQTVEVTLDVVRERLGGRVALRRLLRQRLQHDVVEVAGQHL